MSVKEWYRLLLEKNVSMREVPQEARLEYISLKVEGRHPDVLWSVCYRTSRLTGLSSESKSFLFQLIRTLLPSKEKSTTPTLIPLPYDISYKHLFFEC